MIAAEIGTRTPSQIRTHAQKFFLRLKEITGHHKDADILRYIKEHPTNFFMGNSEKFARLGLRHLSVDSDPATPELAGRKRVRSEGSANVPSAETALRCGSDEERLSAFRYRATSTEKWPPNCSAATRPASFSAYNNMATGLSDFAPMMQVLEGSRTIGTALEKAYLDLIGYCQRVDTFSMLVRTRGPGAETVNYGEYLQQSGMALKSLIRGIVDTQNKSTSIITYTLMHLQTANEAGPNMSAAAQRVSPQALHQ